MGLQGAWAKARGMPRYRRLFVPGGTYFFTVTLLDRRAETLVAHIDALRSAYAATLVRHPFVTRAIVVLPDHLHAVWTLPPGDSDFPARWKMLRAHFARAVEAPPRTAAQARRRERGIWQRRYWEHMIRDERDYRAHVEYCWWNPVKHGLVEHPADWPFSSFRRADICPPTPGAAQTKADKCPPYDGDPGWRHFGQRFQSRRQETGPLSDYFESMG